METKDFIIGSLLIGMVAVAGWIGFLYVNPVTITKTEEDEETIYILQDVLRTYESGLPEDWSTAPITSKIILYNETGDPVEITLEQILEYVEKWEETDPEKVGNEGKKNWWEKRLQPLTVTDSSGIPITGVDVLDLLRVFDCNFAGELEFVSHDPDIDNLGMDVIDICNILDEDNNYILGLAADKQWLRDSPIADESGDFLILGKEVTYNDDATNITEIVEYKCYDLANITVTKNWTITVNVYNNDDSLNQTLVLDAFNITDAYGADPYHYEYENTVWWNFNRSYYGTNISQIVDYTKAKDTDYLLNITFSPGDTQPANKTYRGVYSYSKYFNYTDVEIGIKTNATGHVIGNHVDLVNGSSPMFGSDLKMCLTNKIKYYYESKETYFNSPWDEFYNDGYPPFQLIIPGLSRSRFYNGVMEINIKILSNTR
ncbi:hypothetical protein ES705_04627 [subsurface metagenome]